MAGAATGDWKCEAVCASFRVACWAGGRGQLRSFIGGVRCLVYALDPRLSFHFGSCLEYKVIHYLLFMP